MAFLHTVIEIKNVNGEIVEKKIAEFYADVPFGANALREFKRLSRSRVKLRLVRDNTLAGMHYSTPDGTVVYELR